MHVLKTFALSFPMLVALFSLAGCAGLGGLLNATRGSGNVKTESREISGFHAVSLAGSGNLTIDQNGTESLNIDAEDNILPLLTSDVAGGTLTLGTRPNTTFSASRPINYRLTVKDLTGLSISGSGRVDASNVRANALRVQVSGSGAVRLAGQADSQDVQISGSGGFDGEKLAGREANVSVSGSGRATLNVSDRLSAILTGSGRVDYLGSPTLTQSISGSGRVERR